MNQAFVFSDLHGHDWREFATPMPWKDQVINGRLLDAWKVVRWVRRECESRGIKTVIFAGDLFHKKRIIEVGVYNVIANAFYDLARIAHVIVLAGNHDLARRSAAGSFSHEHALYALSAHKNIRVVDQPMVHVGLGFVPYASDRDTLLSGVEKVAQPNVRQLVMHAGVAGAATGPIEWQPPEPVTVEDLPEVAILSGHYHKPQVVGDRVTYIGSPLEHVRGDGKALERGGLIIDLDDASAGYERVAYKGPRFISRRAWQLKAEGVKGHFVDLLLKDSAEAQAGLEALMAAGARGVHPVFVARAQETQARMQVEVGANGLPSVELLCQKLIETTGKDMDGAKLWQVAQAALQAADTEA